MLAVDPISYTKHKADWEKVVAVFYKAVDYILDEKTKEDAVKIMAAKVGADPAEYIKAIPGTHYLTVAEAKKAFAKGPGLDSIYGSMTIGNKFNIDNKVYKVSQKPGELPGSRDRGRHAVAPDRDARRHYPWLHAIGSD